MNPALSNRRCILLCLALVAGLSGLSARLVYLQVVKADSFAAKSDRVSVRREILRANRGCIVDINDQLIARNIPRVRLALDKKLLRDVAPAALSVANKELRETPEWQQWDEKKRSSEVKKRATKLREEVAADVLIERHIAHVVQVFSRTLGMTQQEFRSSMRLDIKKRHYEVIKKDLEEDDADKLAALARDHNIMHTFIFEETQKRWYVMAETAPHILGYTNLVLDKKSGEARLKGVAGVERYLDKWMAGKDGYVRNHRDKFDLLAVAKPQEIHPPIHGLNVQLTLDMGLQAIAEQELDAGLEKFKSTRGTVVLMNPHTGAIMAIANRPKYNLITREDIQTNEYDFAIQAIYEPGSTFKIIAAAGALDMGLVNPNTEIFCHGGIYRNGSVRVPDHHPYGNLTVEGVLAKSSNIGAYKLALQLGRGNFFNYVDRFGFGSKTGITLGGESTGVIRNTGNPTDFSRASYGYAVNVTPLQVACAYSAIANGGNLMKPQLIKSIMANNGAIIKKYKPQIRHRAISQKTARQMRNALATVVHPKGTAKRAAVPGYRAAGKTGTTKKHNPKGGYYHDKYTVSFAGMLPVDKPEFVCVVVIDDPQTTEVKRYGGTIAAPIFSKVAARVAARMGIERTEPVEPAAPLAGTTNH